MDPLDIAAHSPDESSTATRSSTASAAFRERALHLLNWTASQLLLAEDPLELVHRIYDRMSEILELDAYFHFQVQTPGKMLRLVAWSGVSEDDAEGLRELPFGEAVCGTVAQTRQECTVSRVQASDDPKVAWIRDLGFTAYACQPLRVEDRLLGTLSFGSRRLSAFPPETLDLIRAVSVHVAVALDARKKREALRQQAEELARADRQKDHFLAILGHELRNPLAALDTAMRLLDSGTGDARRVRAVIRSEVEQLTILVNDLLDVSRITRGAIELKKKEIDLAASAREAVEAVRASIAEKRQELTVVESAPAPLYADPIRVKQIVVNLLSNATKYTPDEGRIRLEIGRKDGQAVLRLIDEGRGIEPSLLESIFEPFERGERAGEGLGLGLSLARSLAEMHGGTLTADSQGPERGSTFTLRLPMKPEKTLDLSSDGATAWSSATPTGLRLLVVDDHQNTADLLAILLREEGYAVEVAYTGTEAIQKARRSGPDAVLLDLALPDIDGCRVAREIRERDAGIFLLAVTGFSDDETRRRVEEAGFDHKLLKPVDLEELRRLLARLRDGS